MLFKLMIYVVHKELTIKVLIKVKQYNPKTIPIYMFPKKSRFIMVQNVLFLLYSFKTAILNAYEGLQMFSTQRIL